MKDLGELHHFRGMHVQRDGASLLLSQRQYMLEILACWHGRVQALHYPCRHQYEAT